MNSNNSIEISRFRKLEDCGNLRAFASIKVNMFEIRGLRIIQQPGQRPYLAMPQQEGKGRYYTMVKCLDVELLNQIKTTVLDYWNSQNNRID